MINKIIVATGEYRITQSPNMLITLGLGSCVGVAIYDYINKIGGLIHVMLPENRKRINIAKYADTGISQMISKMVKKGANKTSMVAKIAGGAMMFKIDNENDKFKIGERNVKTTRKVLQKEGVKLRGEEVGKNYSRSIKFNTANGVVLVSSYMQNSTIL